MKKFDKVFLHIGFDKTGTTAVQMALDNSREFLLDKEGIAYLPANRPSINHHVLDSCFSSKVRKLELPFNRYFENIDAINVRDDAYLQQVVNWLDKIQSGKAVVISYEGFPGMNVQSLVKLKKFILTYTDEINVIVYVRPPLSRVTSAMCQRVRSGRIAYPDGHPPLINIKNIFSRFIPVFDKKNISIHPYQLDLLHEQDIVTDFFVRHLQASSSTIAHCADKSRKNSGFSHNAVVFGNYLIEAAEKHSMTHILNTIDFNKVFGKYLQGIPGENPRLTKQQIDEVLDKSKENNMFLEQEFGITFEESVSDYLISEHQHYSSEMKSMLRSIAENCILLEKDRPSQPINNTRANGKYHKKLKSIRTKLNQFRDKIYTVRI